MAFSSFARRRAVDFWPTQWRHAQRNAAAETAISTAVFLEAAPSTLVDEGKAARTRKNHALRRVLIVRTFNRELCEKAVAPEVSRERKDETEGVRAHLVRFDGSELRYVVAVARK